MKNQDEVYVQTIKRNVLIWITTISLAGALLASLKGSLTGLSIALLGIAAIQSFRHEKAVRRLGQLAGEQVYHRTKRK